MAGLSGSAVRHQRGWWVPHAALDEGHEAAAPEGREMRFAFTLVVILVLAGCEKPAGKLPPEIGRWAVVPAPSVPDAPLATRAAWRIDTVTGALEYCDYAPSQGILACSEPARAHKP